MAETAEAVEFALMLNTRLKPGAHESPRYLPRGALRTK